MSRAGGIQLAPSLNWRRSWQSTDPFSAADRAACRLHRPWLNGGPQPWASPLAILRQPSSSLAGVARGLVLQLVGPEQELDLVLEQSTTAED